MRGGEPEVDDFSASASESFTFQRLVEAMDMSIQTLGAKANGGLATRWEPIKGFAADAAPKSIEARWEPIKNFAADPAQQGFERLVEAMSTFGADLLGDGAFTSAADSQKVDQLAGAHHAWRSSQSIRSDFHASIE